MGRRKKSTKKVQTRKKQVVSTVFKCPFCSHDEAVECKMCPQQLAPFHFALLTLVYWFLPLARDRERNIGHLSCRVCTESFQTPIHCTSPPLSRSNLSAPIDVYTDWIDECEALNA
ncbi:hypothetical protein BBJ28_00005523 [Nothophytophthora sp. Chile5]|nr:hypothetical protein BBJ28_00005523 [Nothophytophthora sp. Chile5]